MRLCDALIPFLFCPPNTKGNCFLALKNHPLPKPPYTKSFALKASTGLIYTPSDCHKQAIKNYI